MKIIYLANVRFPSERAHTTQIASVCSAFSNLGHKVVLFVSGRESDSTKVATYELLNIKSVFSSTSKTIFYIGEFIFVIKVLLKIRKEPFDIVYTRNEIFAWFLSQFFSKEKIVWESHEAKLNYFAKAILTNTIKTVVISEGIIRVYEKFLGNTCSLLVAHDGVSEDFFTDLPTDAKRKAREKFNIPLDKKVVAYIGGFDAWKGVETFFEAASFNTDVLFVAIGGSTEQINKIQDIYPRVKFLGFSPYTELAFNQQIADILVIPNTAKNILSSSYTSPLKLFAYMTSEVPILCSDIDSLRSVVSEESAYFFEADNAQALAGKVDEILNDQAGSSKKADQALTLAKNYTWKKRAALIENFIGK